MAADRFCQPANHRAFNSDSCGRRTPGCNVLGQNRCHKVAQRCDGLSRPLHIAKKATILGARVRDDLTKGIESLVSHAVLRRFPHKKPLRFGTACSWKYET